MKLGYTFDEKILKEISINDFFKKIYNEKIKSIEISPDEKLLSLDEYKKIAELSTDKKININFHVPYFIDELYEIMNLNNNRKDVIDSYKKLLKLINELQDITCKSSMLVIHGGKYKKKEKKSKGIYFTLSFLDWMLNFIERKKLNITLAFETLNKENDRQVGDTREDVSYIINKFNDSKLGICWDITHDYFNNQKKIKFNDLSIKDIYYCHIHGRIKNKSHTSIKKSDIDFSKQLNYLIKNDYNGILNIELLSQYSKKYLDDLLNDIDYLNNLVNKERS
ncbi:MAG: sugar phosphate isomerase/epimerase [Firmicutes bacterium]|nr:sugar phosphate isomerase/epimerase [Bacillota bacterium]